MPANPNKSATQNLDALRREVDTTFALVAATSIDRAVIFTDLLSQASEHDGPLLLTYLVDRWADRPDTSGELRVDPTISATRLRELETQYATIIDGMLKLLFDRNGPEDAFYDGLYHLVRNPVFATADARAFALYWALIDNRIPYFQITDFGLSMSDDDWRTLGRQQALLRAKIRFILTASRPDRVITQRSQEADLLLKELDQIPDPASRARLMGYLVWFLREQRDNAVEQMLRESL